MSPIDHSLDTQAPTEQQTALATRSRIKSLFERYPNIANEEKRELAAYLRSGPLLDIGLLKGDEEIRYKIAAFEQDNQQALRTSPMELAVLITILAVAALVCSALWNAGQ